jgi:uncharacterized OsmC-like protein
MMLEYAVSAKRLDDTGSEAAAGEASIILDTGMAGRPDAFNPAELLLASLAACMVKGAERVAPMIKFDLRGFEVSLHGQRQDSPPKMLAINYELVVDTSVAKVRVTPFRSRTAICSRKVCRGGKENCMTSSVYEHCLHGS